jgi:hypothetical protein
LVAILVPISRPSSPQACPTLPTPASSSYHTGLAQPQIHTTCDDCISILQDAASLISSKSLEASSVTLFLTKHQSRLAANVSSSKCYMCTLLYAQIPRLLEPFNSGEALALAISRARHEPHAATVGLLGFEREAVDRQTHYQGSLRIQHGEKT